MTDTNTNLFNSARKGEAFSEKINTSAPGGGGRMSTHIQQVIARATISDEHRLSNALDFTDTVVGLIEHAL